MQMLIADMFRGWDSTGVFGVNKYGNVDLYKDQGAATLFLGRPGINKFLDKIASDYHIVVGHNRKATMGAVNAENAHPFIEGNTCLVHNGTLQNHRKLADRVVDSNAVAAHIEEHGYKSMFKQVEGAYAFIWYNADNKTLYFARNAERPVFLVETDDAIYLASEGKMLDWILDRNDLTKYSVQNVPTDKVFKFDLETRALTAETKPKKESASQSRHSNKHQRKHGMHMAFSTSGQNASNQSGSSSANISTYSSGQTVQLVIDDFTVQPNSTQIMCRTLDGLDTTAIMWLPHLQYSQEIRNKIVDAEVLKGVISSITSKNGNVTIYLKSVEVSNEVIMEDGSIIEIAMVEEAGGLCYCCSNPLKTADQIYNAEITQNSIGSVLYMICEDCKDTWTFQGVAH